MSTILKVTSAKLHVQHSPFLKCARRWKTCTQETRFAWKKSNMIIYLMYFTKKYWCISDSGNRVIHFRLQCIFCYGTSDKIDSPISLEMFAARPMWERASPRIPLHPDMKATTQEMLNFWTDNSWKGTEGAFIVIYSSPVVLERASKYSWSQECLSS